MSSWWYGTASSKSSEELNPLLPYIAGVIENVGEAGFSVIRDQIESDLEQKVSDTKLGRALETGIKLGVLNMTREFKVCREFTTKEIQRSKTPDNAITGEVYDISYTPQDDDKLMSYVKHQREKRNKLRKRGKGFGNSLSTKCIKDNVGRYKYLCQKCRRSVEREIKNKRALGAFSEEDDDKRRQASSRESSNVSTCSENSDEEEKFSDEFQKPPEKSRLLVEKNPMETDQPYCDIFT